MRDDNELMACVQNGDKAAYDELVLRHRVSAVSFAYSLMSDLQAAEDAVQDVFVKIYIDRDKYRPIYSFKTFLYRSVRNKCVDYMRKRRLNTYVDLDSITEIADSCEGMLIRTEYIHAIYSIMNTLQKDYKTALYLYSVGQMSYAEIARVMNKTVPQIKIIIFRARRKLKTALKEAYGDEE